MSALLVSMVAGTQLNMGKANPLPPMYTRITIEQPLNTAYHENTVRLFFSVDTDYALNSYYYSLDGQERQPVENTTIILQEDINAGKNPPIIRTVLNGSCVLSNLSEGWHNVTVYQISHLIGGDPEYEIPFSESITFKKDAVFPSIGQEPFSTSPSISPSPSSAMLFSPSPSLTPPPNQEAPQDIAFTAAVIAALVVSVGLLVYFKKRKS